MASRYSLPEDHHRHGRGASVRAPRFRQSGSIRRLWPPLLQRGQNSRCSKTSSGDIVRQWPLQSRRRRPFQIVLGSCARHAKKSPDLAARSRHRGEAAKGIAIAASSVPARRHPVSSSNSDESGVPQVLTCGEQTARTKNCSGGRLQSRKSRPVSIGMVAGIKSESPGRIEIRIPHRGLGDGRAIAASGSGHLFFASRSPVVESSLVPRGQLGLFVYLLTRSKGETIGLAPSP